MRETARGRQHPTRRRHHHTEGRVGARSQVAEGPCTVMSASGWRGPGIFGAWRPSQGRAVCLAPREHSSAPNFHPLPFPPRSPSLLTALNSERLLRTLVALPVLLEQGSEGEPRVHAFRRVKRQPFKMGGIKVVSPQVQPETQNSEFLPVRKLQVAYFQDVISAKAPNGEMY